MVKEITLYFDFLISAKSCIVSKAVWYVSSVSFPQKYPDNKSSLYSKGSSVFWSIDVLNVSAYDRFGNEIRSQVRQTQGFSVIILDVYYPLLPGFEYEFNLNYVLSYNPSGIFFKSLSIQ